MFLKPRWHVPDQNLVKCTPQEFPSLKELASMLWVSLVFRPMDVNPFCFHKPVDSFFFIFFIFFIHLFIVGW